MAGQRKSPVSEKKNITLSLGPSKVQDKDFWKEGVFPMGPKGKVLPGERSRHEAWTSSVVSRVRVLWRGSTV